MTIIIKTEMKDLPNSCKECDLSVKGYGNTMCPFLRDWLEPFEIRSGKTKLDKCPLEKTDV